MAFLRKRADQFSLSFKWKGKSYIKALGTSDEKVANRIKKDAEDQLKRIRNGKSPLAAQLLADGFKITDVLFGSPEVALRIGKNSPDDNPLPLSELTQAYLAQMPSTHSADHRYSVGLWLNKICEGIGPDRPVMSLATTDLEEYRKKRVGPKPVPSSSSA